MSTWVAGIIGFIIGWITEWLIDLVYWRRRAEGQTTTPDAKRPVDGRAEPAVPSAILREKDQIIRDLRDRLGERDGTVNRLEAALAAKEEEIRALSARVKQLAAASVRDDLTDIKGIGPAYAERLRKAGITSFTQLAELTPERVREMLNLPQWRRIDPEAWIEQAAQLSGGRQA